MRRFLKLFIFSLFFACFLLAFWLLFVCALVRARVPPVRLAALRFLFVFCLLCVCCLCVCWLACQFICNCFTSRSVKKQACKPPSLESSKCLGGIREAITILNILLVFFEALNSLGDAELEPCSKLSTLSLHGGTL